MLQILALLLLLAVSAKPDKDISETAAQIARAVCENPGRLSDGFVARVAPGAALSLASAVRRRLSGCALAVFDGMVALVRGPRTAMPVSRKWLAARVGEYRASIAAPVMGGGVGGTVQQEPTCSVASGVRGCPR